MLIIHDIIMMSGNTVEIMMTYDCYNINFTIITVRTRIRSSNDYFINALAVSPWCDQCQCMMVYVPIVPNVPGTSSATYTTCCRQCLPPPCLVVVGAYCLHRDSTPIIVSLTQTTDHHQDIVVAIIIYQ